MKSNVDASYRRFLAAGYMFASGLLVYGCGGGESAPASVAATQNASEQNRLDSENPEAASQARKLSAPSKAADENVPTAASPGMRQLSALPQMSSLSEPEKAGLLMLLPSKSPSQRMQLINMYPGLAALNEQQKEILLDKLDKIVPLATTRR
ncbi:hypothetical protein [Caballeronia sp. ATUFL_M2_KS44]|uniref:hypothetical protein n=1 Tax=Caballeronia sp. ATUFL_M2_KS44 TaxID=2921767 RepID=UPI0020288ADD